MFITSPEAFADLFNIKSPGAYRKVTFDDVCHMTGCKLIDRYRFYGRQDLETIRGSCFMNNCVRISQYSKIKKRSHRSAKSVGNYTLYNIAFRRVAALFFIAR